MPRRLVCESTQFGIRPVRMEVEVLGTHREGVGETALVGSAPRQECHSLCRRFDSDFRHVVAPYTHRWEPIGFA